MTFCIPTYILQKRLTGPKSLSGKFLKSFPLSRQVSKGGLRDVGRLVVEARIHTLLDSQTLNRAFYS